MCVYVCIYVCLCVYECSRMHACVRARARVCVYNSSVSFITTGNLTYNLNNKCLIFYFCNKNMLITVLDISVKY